MRALGRCLRSSRTRRGRHICVGQCRKDSKAKGATGRHPRARQGMSPHVGEPPRHHAHASGRCADTRGDGICLGGNAVCFEGWLQLSDSKMCIAQTLRTSQRLLICIRRWADSPAARSSVPSPPPTLSSRCKPGPGSGQPPTWLTAHSAATCPCFPDFFRQYSSGF